MSDLICYKLAHGLYFVVLILPLGLAAGVIQQFESVPGYLETAGWLLAVGYFIYASFWSRKAAQMNVFDHRPTGLALVEARIQLNVDIRVWLAFLPIIGAWFEPDDRDKWKRQN